MNTLIQKIQKILHCFFEIKKDPFPGAILKGVASNVVLGDSVSLGGEVVLFATEKITIGEHSMIGHQAMLHTSTHDFNQHPMWTVRIDRPIEIGAHVWIGARAIILAGVKVGSHSVIGAGAVVTSHVPDFAIVAGNPARILGFRTEINRKVTIKSYPTDAVVVKQDFLKSDKITKRK